MFITKKKLANIVKGEVTVALGLLYKIFPEIERVKQEVSSTEKDLKDYIHRTDQLLKDYINSTTKDLKDYIHDEVRDELEDSRTQHVDFQVEALNLSEKLDALLQNVPEDKKELMELIEKTTLTSHNNLVEGINNQNNTMYETLTQGFMTLGNILMQNQKQPQEAPKSVAPQPVQAQQPVSPQPVQAQQPEPEIPQYIPADPQPNMGYASSGDFGGGNIGGIKVDGNGIPIGVPIKSPDEFLRNMASAGDIISSQGYNPQGE